MLAMFIMSQQEPIHFAVNQLSFLIVSFVRVIAMEWFRMIASTFKVHSSKRKKQSFRSMYNQLTISDVFEEMWGWLKKTFYKCFYKWYSLKTVLYNVSCSIISCGNVFFQSRVGYT